MPALSNPKHERFAQSLAKGMTQAEAYADAGYKPSEPNASRLTSNDKVQARLAELQERAATRTEITVASITERLLAIAAKAEKSGDAPMLQAARASLMDAAKLNGLVVEKGEHQHKHVGLSVTYVTPAETQAPASPEDYETGE
ncbi:terminase small subunit [Brevundimonas diminuta]